MSDPVHVSPNAGVDAGIGVGPERWVAGDARPSSAKTEPCEVRG